MEVLLAMGILSVLIFPILQFWMASRHRATRLPRRVFAYQFAQNLLDERLFLPYDKVRSIRPRKLSRFRWIQNNFDDLMTSGDLSARAWVQRSETFLGQFQAEVRVEELVPDQLKSITAIVSWVEGNAPRDVVLTGSYPR